MADPLHDVQEVFQGAGEAAELSDDEDITLAPLVEQALQFWPVPSAAGGGFLEQAPATLRALVCMTLFWSSPLETRA